MWVTEPVSVRSAWVSCSAGVRVLNLERGKDLLEDFRDSSMPETPGLETLTPG